MLWLCAFLLAGQSTLLNAQAVKWGYTVTKGQTLHFVKHQTMLVSGKPEALTLEEHFEVIIRAVDSTGSFLCSVRSAYEQARPDSSGTPTYSSVFFGPSIIADGTFAEMSISRCGRYEAGRFEKEPYYSIKRREAQIHQRTHGVDEIAVESPQDLLRHLSNDLFPPLCDSVQCSVGSAWIDSVNVQYRQDPTDSLRQTRTEHPNISPLQWRFNSIGYYGETKCRVLSARQKNVLLLRQAPDDAIIASRQDVYLRESDGVVVHQDVELKGVRPDGKSFTCQVQYDLEP